MTVEADAAHEALARLRRWGGDALVRSMTSLFADGVAERMGAMRAALAAEDRPALARAAHALKASCGQLGADPAAALCRELEATAFAADAATLSALVARLDSACAAHVAWLEHELRGSPPP